MPEGMLHPSSITVATLRRIFDDAYFETEVDSDGDLIVRDRFHLYVLPHGGGSKLRLLALFGARPHAEHLAKLRLVNKINDTLAIVRAAINSRGAFCFDHYINVDGGLPARNLVIAVKDFNSVIEEVAELDNEDVMS